MAIAWSAVVLNVGALLTGCLLCALFLPVVMRVATQRGLLDQPDGGRHAHERAVPRLGGVALTLSVGLTLGLAVALIPALGLTDRSWLPLGPLLPGFLAGAVVVFATGLVDDIRGVRPSVKLMAQALAAGSVMVAGFLPHRIGLMPGGAVLDVGMILGGALTLFWIIGISNAFNLIDGLDGLAGSVALLALTTALISDAILNLRGDFVLIMATVGAVLAFLRLNWHPARIFLGDAGSMVLGFFLAVRTVVAATDANGVTYPIVPLFALAFPLADTLTSMARRWVRGHPFSRADGRHIHHQLRQLGFSVPRTVQLLALVFSTVAALGIAIVFAPARLSLTLAVIGIVAVFAVAVYGLRWLGYAEFVEMGASIASVVRHARTVVQEKLFSADIAVQIERAQSLSEVRALLAQVVVETRVLDLELLVRDEQLRWAGASGLLSPGGHAQALRLDYPIRYTSDGECDVTLRVWSAKPETGAHPIAERVALRLGPALEAWFSSQAAHVSATVIPAA